MNAVVGLSLAAAVSGALHIRAETHGPPAQRYLFKPLTTSLLIAIALVAPGATPSPYRELIVAGLVFSLAGDVFLMLPSDRFLQGLASFLVAHLLYIAAFCADTGFQFSPLALAPFALASGAYLALLWPHLAGMRIAVVVYVTAIAVMGWQAAAQYLGTDGVFAIYALVGAVLFTISDATLAWNRFRAPFAGAQAAVLGSYYLAQWFIALSVAR